MSIAATVHNSLTYILGNTQCTIKYWKFNMIVYVLLKYSSPYSFFTSSFRFSQASLKNLIMWTVD